MDRDPPHVEAMTMKFEGRTADKMVSSEIHKMSK